MARKSKITKGRFASAYRKAKDVNDLGRILNIAAPTVYKYIKKYKLDNLNRLTKKIPDADIMKAMKDVKNLNKAALALDMAPTSLRQRCYRLGIDVTAHKKINNQELAFKFIKAYYVKTVEAIARKHKVEPRQVRHMMQKFSNEYCKENKVPMITKLRDFKIANEIIHNRSLRKDADTLAEVTGMDVLAVETYLRG